MKRKWSDKEIEQLKIVIETQSMSYAEFAEHAGRSYMSVKNKAHRLRQDGEVGYLRNYWTVDELDYLLAAVGDRDSDMSEVANFVGRTKEAVLARACVERSRNDFPYRNRWEEWEINWLKKAYSRAPMAEMRRYLNRSDEAIITKASRLGLHRKSPPKLSLENVKKLAEQGLTRREIADELGSTMNNVTVFCWRHQIECRREEGGNDVFRQINNAFWEQFTNKKRSQMS